jgi:hypothetical protein
MKTELSITLWPSFPHFEKFASDTRIKNIRLNSAMITNTVLESELSLIKKINPKNPLFFDVKARQLRVMESFIVNKNHLELVLNHPIEVETPCVVLFKAGADFAILDRVENGTRLIFKGGPVYNVSAGESLHIRDKSLVVKGDIFIPSELQKIETVKKAGFNKFFLSYVEDQLEIDQFRELVGNDAEIWLKIESKKGLEFTSKFKKEDNLTLVAARGNLFVEVDKPHDIVKAMRLIIEKDPEACVGSRILLSIIDSPIPSCADISEVAWLYDLGYRKMMLCDEICLKDNLLSTAVNAYCAIEKDL